MANTKQILQIVICVANALLFTGTIIVNFTSMGQFENQNSTGGQFANYTLDITPATYAFSIWGLIYAWQAAWIIYSIVNLFRGPELTFLISPKFLIAYMGSNVANMSWIFVAAVAEKMKILLPVSSVILWAIFFCLVAAMIGVSLQIQHKRSVLLKAGYRKDPWLMIVLVQNGVGMYATWCSVASPLNSAISLCYFHGVEMTLAGTVGLTIVALEVVLFVPMDFVALDRWTRYLITPHLTLIWALSAILIRHGVVMGRNSIFTLVLLCVCIGSTIAKIMVMIMRHRRDPQRYGKFADLEKVPDEKDQRF